MSEPRRPSWPRWLVTGWLIAGTCDITYATVFSYIRRGVAPTRVLKFVASGLLGPTALQGGNGVAALGLALHYLNALLFTVAFFLVASQRPAFVRRPVLTGVIYGVLIYGMMNYVVVPLSRIGPLPTPPTIVWSTGLTVHMFLIGLPIVLAARRAFGPVAPDQPSIL